MGKQSFTEDGFDEAFAANYLGHWLLTLMLLQNTYRENGRIAIAGSASHDRVAPLGTAGDDGSGIQLGQMAGGSVSHMDRLSTWRLMYPPEAFSEGIVVSVEGKRIAAEELYGACLGDVMRTRFNGRAYLILDSGKRKKAISHIKEQTQIPWTALIRYLMYWAYKKAGSLECLARKLGVNQETLTTTVIAYKKAIIHGKPDPLGKLKWRLTIARAPFYGIDICLRCSGIKGEKIQDVYAAGNNAVQVSSNCYISGLALADCVSSGKRSGEHAAEPQGLLASIQHYEKSEAYQKQHLLTALPPHPYLAKLQIPEGPPPARTNQISARMAVPDMSDPGRNCIKSRVEYRHSMLQVLIVPREPDSP
ncbi:hypothetical protein F5Y05DRAFT_408395 [Hypoxylon sp. FL0543]|nr:hypothetical protein F5Y05DRAFT_408395 [Hypoxylon sp. FL0543]